MGFIGFTLIAACYLGAGLAVIGFVGGLIAIALYTAPYGILVAGVVTFCIIRDLHKGSKTDG